MIIGPIPFLVLDSGAVGSPEHFSLTWLVPPADAEFQAPAADHIQHRRLLRHTDGVPPGQNIRHLSQANALRLRSDGRLGKQWVRAELWPLRHEVMLGHKPVIEAESVGQDALPNLADEDALIALMDLCQRAIVDHHSIWGRDCWKVGSAVVKDPDLDHGVLLSPGGSGAPRL